MNFKKTTLIATAGTVMTGLFYYAFSGGSDYLDAASIVDAVPNVAGQRQHMPLVDERRENCDSTLLANPFEHGKANCSSSNVTSVNSVTLAAATATAAGNEARSLNVHLNHMKPCQEAQELNAAPIECARLNARAIGVVRQLETLVEQGNPQARFELSGLVQQHSAKTASKEFLYELDRAEAILQQTSAGAGNPTEKKIEPPQYINPRLMAQYGEY